MPTNLPPEYFVAEKRYREAASIDEKIECLEDLLSTIPKHKGTDHLRADLRRRLSKLKESAQTRKKSGTSSPYNIDKEGAGQIILLGPTNVGKSSLVARLTNASPEISDAPFTTWTPTPGMMPVENIQIQLIDTPPLNPDYVDPEMMNLVRRADLLLLVVDLQTNPVQQIEECVDLLVEQRVVPKLIEKQFTGDPRRLFIKPLLVVVNKYDDDDLSEILEIFFELLEVDWPCVAVSALTGHHLERLKETVLQKLDIIRVYTKPPGKGPNFAAPFVLERGATVSDLARQVHLDFFEKMKSARVWGSQVHDGQLVGREHVLSDGDIVELRL
jgi:hypothetical protein